MKLQDFDIHEFGDTIQLVGTVWEKEGNQFVTYFPDPQNNTLGGAIQKIDMDLAEWEMLLHQTDIVEVEIFQKDPSGKIVKAVVRKTQRVIESFISWKVFDRDMYTCRYCGAKAIPLSVDHVVLWEEGGSSIEANLITACKKCNKDRGRMQFGDWLLKLEKLPKYNNVPAELRVRNDATLAMLPELEKLKYTNIKSR